MALPTGVSYVPPLGADVKSSVGGIGIDPILFERTCKGTIGTLHRVQDMRKLAEGIVWVGG